MSYGKFGLKMPITNYNPRMSEAWNTGAAIGNLLGTLWGENYQRRGEKKTYEAAQEILNNMGKQEPASDSLYQDYSNLNISAAEPQASTKATDANASNTTSQNVPSVGIGDIRAIEKANFTKNYIDKYKTDPNAVGNTIAGTNIAETVNRNLKNLNAAQAPSFKAADMRAAIEAELMRRNKPASQIANAMKLIEPQILAKEQEYNKNKSDELYQQYLASNGADMNALADLSKYNPALAKYAYDNAIYNRNRQDKLADIESARRWQIESEDRALRNRLAYAGAVGSGGGSRGSRKASASGVLQSLGDYAGATSGKVTGTDINYVEKKIAALEQKREDNNGLSWDDDKTLTGLYKWKRDYEVTTGKAPITPDFITDKVDSLVNQGVPPAQILEFAASQYGLGTKIFQDVVDRLNLRIQAQSDNGYDLDTAWDPEASAAAAETKAAADQAEEDKERIEQYKEEYKPGVLSRIIQDVRSGKFFDYYTRGK